MVSPKTLYDKIWDEHLISSLLSKPDSDKEQFLHRISWLGVLRGESSAPSGNTGINYYYFIENTKK